MHFMYRLIFRLAALSTLLCMATVANAQGRASDDAAESYHRRAIQLTSSGDSTEAAAWFRKAWEADPSNVVYVHDLATYYIHHQNYSEALAIIGDYVKRAGPTALGWTLQGEYLFERKEFDTAYQSLREALNLSNTNYRAHELLGLIFSLHRHYDLGLEELKIAVAQNPHSAQTHFYCGRLYYRMANYSAAREQFTSCLDLSPFYPEATENLGLALEAMGDVPGALERYRQAIAFDEAGKTPRSELPYVCLAALLSKEPGHDAYAEELLNNALVNNPKSPWAHFELGRLYFKQGADTAAAKQLLLAAQFDSNFSRPHFFLGKIYQRSDRSQEAQAEFRRFKELDADPDHREPQKTQATGLSQSLMIR
jgi:tetratricopeptide (TPR) repeat protein